MKLRNICVTKISKSLPPPKITSQYIKNIKKNNIFALYEKDNFLLENDFVKDKKIISISPGGFKGIYMLGICTYIKDNFDLSNYVFSGSSAGGWNALMMCCNKDFSEYKHQIVDYSIKNSNSIFELESLMKLKLLQYFTTDDFDLRKLFIGVTTFNNFYPNTIIFSGFNDLADAIDACIASSHIPFVTGGLTHKYHNLYSFDGGFSRYPYLNISNTALHITPSIWQTSKKHTVIGDINEYTTLFSKNKYNFDILYENGYKDAHKNRVFLQYSLGTKLEE